MKRSLTAFRDSLCVAAIFVLALTPSLAHAQAGGGGGGGNPVAPILQWLQGGVITAIGTLAVIFVGLAMFFRHFHLMTILAVCCGIWVAFNAATIVGWFGG